ncbi:MAG TPA: hypothetical protein PLS49_01300, partial [Candidatus Woesebacteria bacterium]|nr:hypothetical protein [Candidatus Woesebacteria bacterium]
MNILKQVSLHVCIILISFLFVPHVQADALDFEGNTIEVNGTITATQVTNSHIYIAGQFSTVTTANQNAVSRINIVEINRSDMQITDWNPQPNAPIHDMALYKNQLIAVGQFVTFNNIDFKYIATIDINSKEASTLNLQVDQPIYAILIDQDRLYVGGDFQIVNQEKKSYIASYDLRSNTVTVWNPILNGSVYDIST